MQKTDIVDRLGATTVELMDNVCQEMMPFRVVYFSSVWFNGIDGVKDFAIF